MANPSGHTYRYAEHNPVSTPDGPRILYKDGSSRPAADVARQAGVRPTNPPSGPAGGNAGAFWGEVRGLLGRYPVATVLAGLTVGCLTGCCLGGRD